MTDGSEPLFFAEPAALRSWFAAHAGTAEDLLLGYWKRGTGRPSVTWPESVDEALCVGWIDGVRRRIDDDSYSIRFTPRRPRSIWSAVNVARVEALTAEGRMTPAGLAAYERRTTSGVYSHERVAPAQLEPAEEQAFRAVDGAWEFFEAQAPSYRKQALHWVTTAKRPDTRARRLAMLVEDSAAGQRLAQLSTGRRR